MTEADALIADLKSYIAGLQETWCTELDGNLYHYTDTESVRGILRDGALHSHDALRMDKDPYEIRAPLAAVQPVVNLFWHPLPFRITDFLRPAGVMGLADRYYYAFIASFTSAADSLLHWETFAQQGQGAAIGVRLREFADCADLFALFEVQYDEKLLTATIDAAFRCYLGHPSIAALSFEAQEELHLEFCMSVLGVLLRFKRSDCKPEAEWRALALRPENPAQGYIPFPLRREAVSHIVLGPHCQISEAEIRESLKAGGLDGVPVCRSKLVALGPQ